METETDDAATNAAKAIALAELRAEFDILVKQRAQLIQRIVDPQIDAHYRAALQATLDFVDASMKTASAVLQPAGDGTVRKYSESDLRITPEMIEAGECAVWQGFGAIEIPNDFHPVGIAIRVFLAMINASPSLELRSPTAYAKDQIDNIAEMERDWRETLEDPETSAEDREMVLEAIDGLAILKERFQCH